MAGGRHGDKHDFTPKQIGEFGRQVKEIGAWFEEIEKEGNEGKFTTLTVTHFKTAEKSIDGLAKFAGAMKAAVTASRLNKTLLKEELLEVSESPKFDEAVGEAKKTRATTKKSPKKPTKKQAK